MTNNSKKTDKTNPFLTAFKANLNDSLEFDLHDEEQTKWLAGCLAQFLQQKFPPQKQSSTFPVIYLHGDLGAGKTTFSRHFIQAFGYKKAVKSPTYNIVEIYNLTGFSIYHFDLYRISCADELEYIGIREYFTQPSVALIEWAELGEGAIAPADIEIKLTNNSSMHHASIKFISDKF